MFLGANLSHSDRALISERMNKLAQYLSDGVYEREHTIKLCLLSALSGESVFLLGPPGIAKSLIAKRLIQAFDDASYFEYLMTRFSTPEEVFGPLSIQELKDNGRYVRLTEGYLPTAQVVFLDEIWKAGPAILNTLLTVVNEKTFKNGDEIKKIPMRLLISASNELPEENSGLEALYDRMLVKIFVNRIQNKQNFKSMLTAGSEQETKIPAGLAITDDEYFLWLELLERLALPDELFDKLYLLKQTLEKSSMASGSGENYISDRRWKKSVKLLKASAFFSGRDQINPLDFILLKYCLWSTLESRSFIEESIDKFMLTEAFGQERIEANVNQCQDDLNFIQSEIEDIFSITLVPEPNTGLRKKAQYTCNQKTTQFYNINQATDLIKLVLLEPNMSVNESEKGDCRWVYITKTDFDRVLKDGKGFIYGYVNQNPNMCRVIFDLDSFNRLVIKDIANRNVLVALAGAKKIDQADFEHWQVRIHEALHLLQESILFLQKAKANFHSALPHNFVEPKILCEIEEGFDKCYTLVEVIKDKYEKRAFRLKNMSTFFV